jgi:stage II sporulation protein D
MRRLLPLAALAVLLALAPSANAAALFVIKGRGWGHAIGMSQWGAQGMALRNVGYPAILGHYYQGTSLGPPPDGISSRRVLLDSGRSSMTLSSDAPFKVGSHTLQGHTNYTLVPTADRKVRVVGVGKVGNPALFERTTAWLELGGRPYRGELQVRVFQRRLAIVNIVGLNRYLYGVVPGEMPSGALPSGFADEALKAQAVAARSFAVRSHLASWYDLYDDTRSQVYEGVAGETPRATAAVNRTGNSVVRFGAAVAQTYYSSSSGGQTSTPKDAWGAAATNLPYLKSVADPDDLIAANPRRSWRELRTAAQMKRLLGLARTPNDGIALRNSSDRVRALTMSGRGWTQTVAPDGGDRFRSILSINSNRFWLGVLRLTASRRRVEWGESSTLFARVRALSGAVLERRRFGGSWRDVRAVTETARITVRPGITTWFRLDTPSTPGVTVGIAVEPKLRIQTARPGSLSGTMRPKLAGTTVSIQRLTAGGWRKVAEASVAADGDWKAVFSVRQGATYRAAAAPGHGYVPGTSPAVEVS